MVEWVEVRGKTVDVAVAAAMQELSIVDREAVDVEVIQEPEKGFSGARGEGRHRPRKAQDPGSEPQAPARPRRGGRRSPPASSQGSRAPGGRGDRARARFEAGREWPGRPRPRPKQASAGTGPTIDPPAANLRRIRRSRPSGGRADK